MIGIIGAMQSEVKHLCEAMSVHNKHNISGMTFYEGRLHDKDIVVVQSGVGKVFAAACAQTLILRFSPSMIINTGVGGALDESLDLLDLVVATDVLQHDMDTTAAGDALGLISGINRIYFPCDSRIADKLSKAAESLRVRHARGRIATGDCFITDDTRNRFIRETFNAAICEMEGGAIGQVCYINNVPFCIVRSVSDKANHDAEMDYPTLVHSAAAQSFAVLNEFIKSL